MQPGSETRAEKIVLVTASWRNDDDRNENTESKEVDVEGNEEDTEKLPGNQRDGAREEVTPNRVEP